MGTQGGCVTPVGGYGGVYDLSGNAYEWEDSYGGWTGGTDDCFICGGAFNTGADNMRCDFVGWPEYRAGSDGAGVGFRCCSPCPGVAESVYAAMGLCRTQQVEDLNLGELLRRER